MYCCLELKRSQIKFLTIGSTFTFTKTCLEYSMISWTFFNFHHTTFLNFFRPPKMGSFCVILENIEFWRYFPIYILLYQCKKKFLPGRNPIPKPSMYLYIKKYIGKKSEGLSFKMEKLRCTITVDKSSDGSKKLIHDFLKTGFF